MKTIESVNGRGKKIKIFINNINFIREKDSKSCSIIFGKEDSVIIMTPYNEVIKQINEL